MLRVAPNVIRRDSQLIDYPAGVYRSRARVIASVSAAVDPPRRDQTMSEVASRDQGIGTSTIAVVPVSGVMLPLVTTTPVNIRVA